MAKIKYWVDNICYDTTDSETNVYDIKHIATPRFEDKPNLIIVGRDFTEHIYFFVKNGVEHRDNQKPSYIRYRFGKVERVDFCYKGMLHKEGSKSTLLFDVDESSSRMIDRSSNFHLYSEVYHPADLDYREYKEFVVYIKDKKENIFTDLVLNKENSNYFISMYCRDKLGLI